MGTCNFNSKNFLFVDIPGTYSIMSNSEEEEIARNFICFEKPDATVVVLDATCLERNLNLLYQIMEITPNVIACVNLLDEAEKKGITIDLNMLSLKLGIPVVGTIARKPKTLQKLLQTIDEVCTKRTIPSPKLVEYNLEIENCVSRISEQIEKLLPDKNKYLARWISLKLIDGDEKIIKSIFDNLLPQNSNLISISKFNISKNLKDSLISSILQKAEIVKSSVCRYKNLSYNSRDRKIDKIITSKIWGIPIMLSFLAIIFWITIVGANYPSQALSNLFEIIGDYLYTLFENINAPNWVTGIFIDGMYTTLTWVISVMLPPMAIFFPIFTLLEDLGFLPRIAFNLDKCFRKACSSRKTSTNYVYGLWL